MARETAVDRFRRGWATLSTRGLDVSDRTKSRAVMGANNFYVLTGLANIPWAVLIMAHNNWSFLLPGVTHLAMIAVWAIAWWVGKRGYVPWMSGVSLAAAIAQYTFLADIFSRASGFQYTLLAIPALAFALFVPAHGKARVATIAAAALAAAWVYVDPRFASPWVGVSEEWLTVVGALVFASVLCVLFTQAGFADFYFNRERNRNRSLLAEARIASQTDTLTNILNRRGVSPLLTSAAQEGDYCVALGDLDRFKRVNDVLGHGAGDVVLAQAASTLEYSVGGLGAVARWGGEEFLVVMPGLSLDEAEALMNRARMELAERFGGEGVSVTISIGVVHAARFAPRDAVLRHTDALLYEAKASGRNVVVAGTMS